MVREGKKEEGNEREKGEEERGEVREVERERTKKLGEDTERGGSVYVDKRILCLHELLCACIRQQSH